MYIARATILTSTLYTFIEDPTQKPVPLSNQSFPRIPYTLRDAFERVYASNFAVRDL